MGESADEVFELEMLIPVMPACNRVDAFEECTRHKAGNFRKPSGKPAAGRGLLNYSALAVDADHTVIYALHRVVIWTAKTK
jgi:hypothetical protein